MNLWLKNTGQIKPFTTLFYFELMKDLKFNVYIVYPGFKDRNKINLTYPIQNKHISI